MAERTVETVQTDTGSKAGYNTEHWLAWLFSLAAIVLTVIGMLRGFGILGSGYEAGTVTNGGPSTQASAYGAIWDAVVWLLPAIGAALLGMALHRNDHHRMRDLDTVSGNEAGLWHIEHWLSWLIGLATIAFGVLGILVGFDVFGRGSEQPDALPWLLGAITGGMLTNALHAVRHHQLVPGEDYIVRLVERRVTGPGAVPSSTTTTASAIPPEAR